MSPEDYQACIKHRWRFKPSGRGSSKKYLARNLQVSWENGGHVRHNRTQRDYFLHTFIIEERMGLKQPTPSHICDHRDGDEGNCRRENLRWATKRFNGLNRNGKYAAAAYDVAAAFTGPRTELLAMIKEIENARATV